MFAPARHARLPSLFGVLFAPTSVTPVVRVAVVGFLGSGAPGALPIHETFHLHVHSNRYHKTKSNCNITISKLAVNPPTLSHKTAVSSFKKHIMNDNMITDSAFLEFVGGGGGPQ